jgi:hypothetical protein
MPGPAPAVMIQMTHPETGRVDRLIRDESR